MTGTTPTSRFRRQRSLAHPGAGRATTSRSAAFAPASWLFVAVALLLIGVLTYYLTLTTRPEISQISPAPNSSQAPGLVEFEAIITSQREIEDAQFFIDGVLVDSSIDHDGDNQWRVSYEQVLERGHRDVMLVVTDSSGRSAEHSWSFEAAGDVIHPRLALMSPPSTAILAPGLNGIVLQVTTFGELDEVEVMFDGEVVDVEVEQMEVGTEYTNEDGIPIFDWEVRASTRLEGGAARIDARVTDVHGANTASHWTILVAGIAEGAGARYFERTGEYAIEPFLSFWNENNGEVTMGPPVGPPITVDNGGRHQYFRFARLELDENGDVHLGLIGREIFGEPENPPDRPPGNNARMFDATGHYIYGSIREFWEENGGLMSFGFPLSQEFETQHGYAQYFERALIEVTVLGSMEYVELAPLGEQLYEARVREPLVNFSSGEGS